MKSWVERKIRKRRYVDITDTEVAEAEGTDKSMDGESHGYFALTSNSLYEVFLNFFSFIFISWRLITLQYCSGFGHTLT